MQFQNLKLDHTASHFKMGYTDAKPIKASIPMNLKPYVTPKAGIKPTNPYSNFLRTQKLL